MPEKIGIDPGRVKIVWCAASEGEIYAQELREFIGELKAIGPIGTELKRRGEGPGEEKGDPGGGAAKKTIKQKRADTKKSESKREREADPDAVLSQEMCRLLHLRCHLPEEGPARGAADGDRQRAGCPSCIDRS